MKYLLDTNIIIFWLKGRYNIADKIKQVGAANCFVSEVSVAELRFGVACSEPELLEEKRSRLSSFLSHLQIIPFSVAIDLYATEKARLRAKGEIISDFDLLIGATAVQLEMKMVTNNSKHLSRLQGIDLEDWTTV
ncbi:MAG: PIN domain-containing protein [Saprospiraceae bacterium]